MNEDKMQDLEDCRSTTAREGEALNFSQEQSYYDDDAEYDSDTIPFEEEVDKLEGDKRIQLYDQMIGIMKNPSEEKNESRADKIAEQFSEITFLKLKVKLLVNASNKKYKELEVKYDASEETVKTLVKINQSYKEEEEERERYSVWSPPGVNGTPQSPMLSSPQLSEITNSLANLKWGFRKREAELLSQIELYKASTIKLNNSQQRLRGSLRDVCEKLCDGLVVAELIVEKSEETNNNDNSYNDNGVNNPSKLQLQLEDLKKINDSLKQQNTELMVLCANASDADMDIRNPDNVEDTKSEANELKEQQAILKKQQDEQIQQQVESQQQHEELQYEKEILKQVQDELERQQDELKQHQVELKQQKEELQFEQEILKQQQDALDVQQEQLKQEQAELKQDKDELKEVENELKTQILDLNQQQNIKQEQLINDNHSSEILNEEIQSLQTELEFIKDENEKNIFDLSEYNELLKSQVSALSEFVNATEKEKLALAMEIQEEEEGDREASFEELEVRTDTEDHKSLTSKSPKSPSSSSGPTRNAMPAEESLDFKRAFKGGVEPKHERGSYDAFLHASNNSPSLYHRTKIEDEGEHIDEVDEEGCLDFGGDEYYGDGDEEGGFNLLDDSGDNDEGLDNNDDNDINDDNDTYDNKNNDDIDNKSYDKYDDYDKNKANYDEYDNDDDDIDDDINDGIHLNISDYLKQSSNNRLIDAAAQGYHHDNVDNDNDISMDYSEFNDYKATDRDNNSSSDSHKGNKDDFQIIRSRLSNIDSIMDGLDEGDDDEYEVNEVENKVETVEIHDLMHYGGFLESRVGYDMNELKDLDFLLQSHLSSLEGIADGIANKEAHTATMNNQAQPGFLPNPYPQSNNDFTPPSVKSPYINTLKARPRTPVDPSPPSPLRSPLLRSPSRQPTSPLKSPILRPPSRVSTPRSRTGTPGGRTGTGLIESLDDELRSHLEAIENIHARKDSSQRSNDLSIETLYDDKESFGYQKSDTRVQNDYTDTNYLSIQKNLEDKLERLQNDLSLKNGQPQHHLYHEKQPLRDQQHQQFHQQQLKQEENALQHIQAQRALLQAEVQHLNDLKSAMQKDLKVAQLETHKPTQILNLKNGFEGVSNNNVLSNSGGESYSSDDKNNYKEEKERDKIHISQLVESLKVARMAVDISNSDMSKTHLKMSELTLKINYLTGKNKHLQSFYDRYYDNNDEKIRSNRKN